MMQLRCQEKSERKSKNPTILRCYKIKDWILQKSKELAGTKEYHNQILTVRQIYKAVTGEKSVEDYHSIESSIYSIRKRLGHDVIETFRGYGYKFSKK